MWTSIFLQWDSADRIKKKTVRMGTGWFISVVWHSSLMPTLDVSFHLGDYFCCCHFLRTATVRLFSIIAVSLFSQKKTQLDWLPQVLDTDVAQCLRDRTHLMSTSQHLLWQIYNVQYVMTGITHSITITCCKDDTCYTFAGTRSKMFIAANSK